MSVSFKVREYQAGDEDEILELLNLAFGKWPNIKLNTDQLSFWKWKFLDNPKKKNCLVVAEIDERIIGCSHGFYRDVKVGKNMYLLHNGADLAVHPDYRRMGVNVKMREIKQEIRIRNKVDIRVGSTTNPIVIKSRNKQGMTSFPHKLIEMVYIHNVDDAELDFIKRTGYKIYKAGKKTLSALRPKTSFSVIKVKEFGDEADVFWEKVSPHYSYLLKRDKVNLNWRYCDPRAGDFNVYAVIEKGELLGYCVTTVREKNGVLDGLIVDLCALPSYRDVVWALLGKAVEVLSVDVNRMHYLVVEGHPNVSVCSGFGFIAQPTVLDVRYYKEGERIENDIGLLISASANEIMIQYGDTDTI